MDIEKTMEFILEQQAATAAHLAEIGEHGKDVDKRLDRFDKRMDSLAARQEKTDRQIAAIRKLLMAGMKMMVQRDKEADARFKAMDEGINALIEAQQRSEKKLEQLIRALLGKHRNGR